MNDGLDALLAEELARAQSNELVELELPAVDLATLLGEFTALKSEVRAQTRESKRLATATEELVAGAEPSAPPTTTPDRDAAVEALIDVHDRVEAAVAAAEIRTLWPFGAAYAALTSIAEGMRLTMRVIGDRLAKFGVKRVRTVGETFDASTMEATGTTNDASVPPGAVAEELTSGWVTADAVVRVARVIVNRPLVEE